MTAAEQKGQIESSLNAFSSLPLDQAAIQLFQALGYTSDRRIPLSPNTADHFIATFDLEHKLRPDQALTADWQSVDFLFQLTDAEIRNAGQGMLSFDSKGTFDGAIMESCLFFAIHLTREGYTRTQLASITRAVNRLFDMPVMLIFRHGDTITISVIRRRLHKRDDSKDVLEKVTLIKDIRLLNPHRAHIEILHDLSLESLCAVSPVTNFVDLYNSWQRTLDTSELNKRFYKELANWYFWAVDQVEFPEPPAAFGEEPHSRDIRNAINVIRLITRLIFVWFIKEKGLVPAELFNDHTVKGLLRWNDFNESTYYKAILQNLFFATLSTEMNKDRPGSRKFRGKREHGRGQHYMIHNVFRYEDYFVDPIGTFNTYFDDIPFLNGGLFECLDREMEWEGRKVPFRVDGFSDRPDNPLRVPDELFFSDWQRIDLNQIYGTRNATYQVRGIINTLSHFKFTVDENTPIEEEVALDPELLGKVFENLLASYNPETQTTARKQTGSYYTPREFVAYMGDESLKAYLRSALMSRSSMSEEDAGIALDVLFAYSEKEHLFNEEEVSALIEAINNLKLLDPACGSGAFPMGLLHKLVYILGKLDNNNERWRAKQRQKALLETEEAYRIGDQAERQKRLLDIDDVFENNVSDYGRKLFLIENCIYGIDIQPIAVQIARLRFFISLVVNQRGDFSKNNRGIRPLPNLETRFVAADTLIGIKGQWGIRTEEISRKEEELKKVRESHFMARTRETKEKYRKKDRMLREDISTLLEKSAFSEAVREKLAHWDPYNQNVSAPFFDPEWMFGVRKGFDIVIANPPYVRQERIKALKGALKEEFGSFFSGTADLYTYFYKKGIDLLKPGGHLCFIAPNKFMRAAYGKNTRELLGAKATPQIIIDFCDLPIFDATTYPAIVLTEKTKPAGGENLFAATFSHTDQLGDVRETLSTIGFPLPVKSLRTEGWTLEQPEVLALMEKLRKAGTPLGEYVKGRFYRGILTGLNEAFVIDRETRARLIAEDPKSEELIKPWLRGRDIKKWKAEWAGLYVLYIPWHHDLKPYPAVLNHLLKFKDRLENRNAEERDRYEWYALQRYGSEYWQYFSERKIIIPAIANSVQYAIDYSGHFSNDKTSFCVCDDSEYVVGLMNSRVLWWFIKKQAATKQGGFYEFKPMYVTRLPIAPGSPGQKSSVAALVKKILANPDSPDVPRLEAEIDQLVYQLYGLTAREIVLIERSNNARTDISGEAMLELAESD